MKRSALGLAIALGCAPLVGQAQSFHFYCAGLTKVSGAPRSFVSQIFEVGGVDFRKEGAAGKTLGEIEKAWSDFTGCDSKNDHDHCYCSYSESAESVTKSRADYLKAMEDSLLESSSGQMNPSTVRSVDLPGDSIDAAVAKGKAARE